MRHSGATVTVVVSRTCEGCERANKGCMQDDGTAKGGGHAGLRPGAEHRPRPGREPLRHGTHAGTGRRYARTATDTTSSPTPQQQSSQSRQDRWPCSSRAAPPQGTPVLCPRQARNTAIRAYCWTARSLVSVGKRYYKEIARCVPRAICNFRARGVGEG